MNLKYKTLITALLSAAALVLFSCEKDDDTGSVSFVTAYPEFEMAGDRYVSVVQGETFTDPGVVAREGGEEIEVTVSGEVDTSTPGVYDITYSAVNSDNFSGSTTRTVAVLAAPEQAGVDISGAYVRSGVTANVTKLAPGFYLMSNVWGPNLIPGYLVTANGTDITIAEAALSGFGPVSGSGTLDDGTLVLLVTLSNYGIVDSRREWEAQ
ncbi:DUF5011 domain-containing protein [Pontibacter mangrovi]|uniref:DUF5011 domain-containing protein n=1 Tax=Pontibacter mangrovi TaxID=2589816 RepID=A0A501WA79_9BACT|nr:DUF5011 domain-containing protein [Pontibacter mangrovi]TPE43717.1 DUF5011 domain-containing protein [Pontibacter mangrovi]